MNLAIEGYGGGTGNKNLPIEGFGGLGNLATDSIARFSFKRKHTGASIEDEQIATEFKRKIIKTGEDEEITKSFKKEHIKKSYEHE